MEIHKILVPVDFSEHSQRALDEAIELAQKFDAELHLLHCYQVYPVGVASPYDVMLPPSLERTIEESARGLLSEWGRNAARSSSCCPRCSPGAGRGPRRRHRRSRSRGRRPKPWRRSRGRVPGWRHAGTRTPSARRRRESAPCVIDRVADARVEVNHASANQTKDRLTRGRPVG